MPDDDVQAGKQGEKAEGGREHLRVGAGVDQPVGHIKNNAGGVDYNIPRVPAQIAADKNGETAQQ